MRKPFLRCLGDAALIGADDEELASGARRAKPLAVLIYLAMADRPVSRDVLADLLWKEEARPRRLASLRKAIEQVRQWLGSDALPDTPRLTLRRDALDCDVWSLRRTAAGGAPADWRPWQPGTFLAQFDPDAPVDWFHWVDGQAPGIDRLIGSLPAPPRIEIASPAPEPPQSPPGEGLVAQEMKPPAPAVAWKPPAIARFVGVGFVLAAGLILVAPVSDSVDTTETPSSFDAIGPSPPYVNRANRFVLQTVPENVPQSREGVGMPGAYCRPEVIYETRTVAVRARTPWTSIGMDAYAGCDVVEITASGTAAFDTDGGASTPDGRPDLIDPHPFSPVPDAPISGLVCRIGSNPAFFVGAHRVIEVRVAGPIECGMNESQTTNNVYRDNSGAWTVKVTIRHNALAQASKARSR